MGFIDILNRYAGMEGGWYSPEAALDFDQVAQSAPRAVVSEGLADTFRAEQTPPFPDMVAQLFHHSDSPQRASLLEEIDGAQVSPDEADAILPHEVREIAERAQQHDPGVIERVSGFYARHPDIVRTLGNAALTLALARMAARSRH